MHQIKINSLTETITIEGKNYLLLPKDQLEKLLSDNIEQKQDIEVLRKTITNILSLFGILDEQTGTIKESIKNGSEGYLKHILKSLKNIIVLMGLSQFNKKAEAELLEKFSFITPLIPIIDKYAKK